MLTSSCWIRSEIGRVVPSTNGALKFRPAVATRRNLPNRSTIMLSCECTVNMIEVRRPPNSRAASTTRTTMATTASTRKRTKPSTGSPLDEYGRCGPRYQVRGDRCSSGEAGRPHHEAELVLEAASDPCRWHRRGVAAQHRAVTVDQELREVPGDA